MNEPPARQNTSNTIEWISLLGNLVTYGGPQGTLLPEKDYQKGVQQVIQSIQIERASLVDVVRLLGAYLVTEDDVPRCRSISFLAELIIQAPSLIDREEDVHYLAEFFTSRLMDWPALHGALKGCHAIVSSSRVTEEDSVSMLQTLNDGVYVRSLSVKDRSLALRVIHKIVTVYGESALNAGIDLAELVIVSIDGEKDPLCLLDGFKTAQVVLHTFLVLGAHSLHRDMMNAATEEMFDILSCYFPVSFTPPDHDQSITRDDIAHALESTLLTWPGFHASVLDLVEEKMSSIVKQAKIDSIHMLKSISYINQEIISNESRRIWNMLRPELMIASFDGKDYAPSFQSAEDLGIGGEAFTCLSACLKSCDTLGTENPMATVVLSDVAMSDTLTCMRDVGNDTDSFSRSVGSVRSSSVIMNACSYAGGRAWTMCIRQYAPAILDIVDTIDGLESDCFASILMHSMLSDAGHLSPCQVDPGKLDIIRIILSKSLRFVDNLAVMKPGDSSLWVDNQLRWSRDRSAYNHATLLMSQINICKIILANDTFESLWNAALVDELVDGCMKAIMFSPEDDAFVSQTNAALFCMSTSKTGKMYAMGKKLMDSLVQCLERPNCTEVAARCIFTIIGTLSAEDSYILPKILKFIIQELSQIGSGANKVCWEHLVTGLMILEECVSDNSEASAEEIGVLQAMLSTSQSLRWPNVQVENIVHASYQISRRISLQDQQKSIDPNLSSSLLCGPTTMSRFAGIGCALGLHKQAIASICPEGKSLLETSVDLLLENDIVNDLQWRIIFVASVMNKMCGEQANLVHETLARITGLAFESNTESDSKWWKCLETCLHALAKQGEVIEQVLDQLCLNMYNVEWSRNKVYSMLHSMFSPALGREWITKDSHACISVLWHQKTYIAAKRCIQAHRSVTKDGGLVMKIALVHLISAAPKPVIQNDSAFIGEQISDFLGHKDHIDVLITSQSIMEDVLSVFKSLISASEKSRMQICDHLSAIIPNLLTIARDSQYAMARKMALECLESLATLVPYQLLHSFGHDVLKNVIAACDDNKRLVRLAAAKCRETWSR